MHRRYVDHVFRVDEAVARIHHHRLSIDGQAFHQRYDGPGANLAMLIRHARRLGHERRRQRCITQHMHTLDRGRFRGKPIDRTPTIVGVNQPGAARDIGRALRRDDVQHIALDVVELQFHRHALDIDIGKFTVRPVVDHAFVLAGPHRLKQRRLGHQVGIGVEHNDFRFRLGALEIIGHLTHALIRPRRATIRRERNMHHKYAAVGHGFELSAQRERLRPGLPRMQHLRLRRGIVKPRQGVIRHVHARRHDQTIIVECAAAGEPYRLVDGIDPHRFIAHHPHAARGQSTIAARYFAHSGVGRQHEIAQRTGNKAQLALHHGHIDVR